MTEPIPIQRAESRLRKQATHLVNKQFMDNIKKGRFFFILMAVSTVAAILVAIFFDDSRSDDWMAGVYISAIFFWFAAFFFGISDTVNYIRSRWFTKRSVDYYLAMAPQSYLRYDKDKIQYITGPNTVEHNWSAFTSYFEKDNTIYIVPNDKLLEAFYFSKDDIGPEHYNKIKSIVSAKLT